MIYDCKKIYLCSPTFEKITVLNGVQTSSVNCSTYAKDYDQLTFNVDRFINVRGDIVESNGYDLLDVYSYLYLEDIGHFQMQHPTVTNDGEKEIKSIVAYSCEKEFEDKNWVGLKINTGDSDSLEQLAEGNVNALGFAKEFITFYKSNDSNKKDLSLIHLILSKMPGWSVLDDDIDPLLWNVKLSINEENINLYALLTSIIAPKAECIFLFDTINRRIKAISKHSLDYDTNISISFRNLANNVDITVNEDSVFTQMNCQGAEELNFANVNYKNTKIFNLDYFMKEPHMSKELIEKVRVWTDWRNEHRNDFIELSKDYANLNDKIYDVKYRVPTDGLDWSQWDKMEEKLLYENLDYYSALLMSLQASADEFPEYDSNGDYIVKVKEDGTIDHEYYLERLYNKGNGYGGYYTYLEVRDYIIPNIEIAISNLDVIEDEKHDYKTEYETNWSLYGIEELNNKKSDYENRLKALEKYSKPWEELTPDELIEYPGGEAEYNMAGREEYVKYQSYIGNKHTIGSLVYQLNKLEEELKSYENDLEAVELERNKMVEQASMEHSSYNFTDKEIILLNILLHETDYQNTNILTTSIDTTVTKIDKEKELFDDSMSKLSEISQPQFNFSVSLDNLLRIREFQEWTDDLKLLHFIRLGVRDDYNVKLRVVSISWNPCEITPDITLEFSNMITSSTGRSDLTDLLNTENNRGSKNSISIGTGETQSDKEYVTALLQQMIKSQLFNNTINNAIDNATPSVSNSTIQNIVNEYLVSKKINVENIVGTEASFEKLFSTYLNAEFIVTDILKADEGIFNSLSADIISATKIDADVANIENILAGNVGTGNVQTLNLTADNVVINDAVIKDLIAARISVADLMAHSATAELITLISADGKPTIAFQNSTQQFYDSEGNVRVQIGQDANGDFNFIVRGEDGTTALFDETGIKTEGIPEGIIVNNMISSGTIQKDRLSFPIVETDENGKVSITEILDGEGNEFGIKYTEFQTTITDRVLSVESTVDKQAGEIKNKVGISEVNKKISEYDQNTVKSIKDTVAEHTTSIGNITSKVGSLETTVNGDGSTVGLVEKVSNVEQTADRIHLIVESTSIKEDTEHNVTSFDLTDKAITAITNQFVIKSPNGTSTIIEGGEIKTNSVTTEMLATDAIKSSNYKNVDSDTLYSESGTFFDLVNGSITSKNFIIDSDGNTYFNGTVTATAGVIGGCNIENGVLKVPIANIIGTLAIGNINGLQNTIDNLNGIISDLEDINEGLNREIGNHAGILAEWCYNNDTTYIDGGNIYAGTISAKLLNSECLTSFNYVNNPNSVFSNSGTKIYLGDSINGTITPGYIKSQNFAITSSGDVYFKGNVEAVSGRIANWEIDNDNLKSVKVGVVTNPTYHPIYKAFISSNFYGENSEILSDMNQKDYEDGMEEDFLPSTGSKSFLPIIALYTKNYFSDGSNNITSEDQLTTEQLETIDKNFVLYGNGRLVLQNNRFEFVDSKFIAKSSDGFFQIQDGILRGYHKEEWVDVVDSEIDLSAYYSDGYKLTIKNENGIYLQSKDIVIHSTEEEHSYVTVDGIIEATELKVMTDIACDGITCGDLNSLTAEISSLTSDTISCSSISSDTASFSESISVKKGIQQVGVNLVNSANDTTSTWFQYNTSVHYYNSSGTLKSKPTTQGYLLNYAGPQNVHQIWLGQSNGSMYHRSGNNTGWGGSASGTGAWKTILDSSNYTSVVDRLVSDEYGVRMYKNTNGNYVFFPIVSSNGNAADDKVYLGATASRWKNIYSTNGTIQTSDANEKHVVENISNSYEEMFMKLRPVTYMWRNLSGDNVHIHDRIHCGLIAQEVNEAAESVGLSPITFAAICRDDLEEPTFDGRTERWGINYSELHGLEIHMIQKTILHQAEQDEKIALLEREIEQLKTTISQLIENLNK